MCGKTIPKWKSNLKIYKKGNEKAPMRLWEGKDSGTQKHHTLQDYKDSAHKFSDPWGTSSDPAQPLDTSSVCLDCSWSPPATVCLSMPTAPHCSPLYKARPRGQEKLRYVAGAASGQTASTLRSA